MVRGGAERSESCVKRTHRHGLPKHRPSVREDVTSFLQIRASVASRHFELQSAVLSTVLARSLAVCAGALPASALSDRVMIVV